MPGTTARDRKWAGTRTTENRNDGKGAPQSTVSRAPPGRFSCIRILHGLAARSASRPVARFSRPMARWRDGPRAMGRLSDTLGHRALPGARRRRESPSRTIYHGGNPAGVRLALTRMRRAPYRTNARRPRAGVLARRAPPPLQRPAARANAPRDLLHSSALTPRYLGMPPAGGEALAAQDLNQPRVESDPRRTTAQPTPPHALPSTGHLSKTGAATEQPAHARERARGARPQLLCLPTARARTELFAPPGRPRCRNVPPLQAPDAPVARRALATPAKTFRRTRVFEPYPATPRFCTPRARDIRIVSSNAPACHSARPRESGGAPRRMLFSAAMTRRRDLMTRRAQPALANPAPRACRSLAALSLRHL